MELANNMPKIPIVLVAGFLGSGKTTLLKHVLTHNNNLKIAVIRNEISDTDLLIEPIYISDQNGKQQEIDFYELPNKCICCSIETELLLTINSIISRCLKNNERAFDLVLVEINGAADPAIIAEELLEYECSNKIAKQGWYFLGTITVLDSSLLNYLIDNNHNINTILGVKLSVSENENFFNLISKQLASADIAILNKVELVNNTDEICRFIESFSNVVEILQVSYSDVCLKKLLSILTNNYNNYNMQKKSIDCINDICNHQCLCSMFYSDMIALDNNIIIDIVKFEQLYNNYLWDLYDDNVLDKKIYRSKGVINGKYQLQTVRVALKIEQLELIPATTNTKILLVGEKLMKNGFVDLLNSCIIS